jgi:hypothetical protein
MLDFLLADDEDCHLDSPFCDGDVKFIHYLNEIDIFYKSMDGMIP